MHSNNSQSQAVGGNLNLIASKFEKYTPKGDYFTALCPSHSDTNNSLSISKNEKGKISRLKFLGDSAVRIQAMGCRSQDKNEFC